MSRAETNDYDSDIAFGNWLRDQRTRLNFTVEQVSRTSGITVDRIKSLEVGYAERGITQAESEKLSAAYSIEIAHFIRHALGGGEELRAAH